MGSYFSQPERVLLLHLGGRKKSARLPTREVGRILLNWSEPEGLLRLLESERA